MFSVFKKKPVPVTDLSWLEVDIHSHLLPGIDDGAPDLATSMHLIEQLYILGLKKFICTPHIFTELYPNTPQTILQKLDLVRRELRNHNLEIEIDAAAEYMIDENFNVLKDLMCLPNQYLLIEMSYLNETPNIEQVIFELQVKGFRVILAHPERYNFYHKNHEMYHRLKKIGCLFQLNLLSVSGYYGEAVKSAADYLLKKGLYDLAATDLHNVKHLERLRSFVCSGKLYKTIGHYEFRNRQLFLRS